MAVTARVAEGVQAIWVVITERDRTTRAIVPREAMEQCWDIGPEQGDLLRAFAAHKDEIEAAVRYEATTSHTSVLLVKDLTAIAALAKRSDGGLWPPTMRQRFFDAARRLRGH